MTFLTTQTLRLLLSLGFILLHIHSFKQNRISKIISSKHHVFKNDLSDESVDVVIIGSGLAGLSCGSLLSHGGMSVTVLESHDVPGGCAHGWTRNGYHFESGPSLYSGFSQDRSSNPLKSIFQIIGEDAEWITYDRWGTCLPEGKFAARIGPDEFNDVLKRYGGPGAVEEWTALMAELMKPGGIADAAQAFSPLFLREDIGVIFPLLLNFPEALVAIKQGQALNEPFSVLRDSLGLRNKFVLNWLDMLCFLLQGLPADGTMSAVIGYMMKDWYAPNVTLDFPKGGSSEIVAALVRGLEKTGRGRLALNSHVVEVLVEGGRAVGVRVRGKDGSERFIRANKAVVANCDLHAIRKLIHKGKHSKLEEMLDKLIQKTPNLKSFIHLHAGIDATGLPLTASEALPAQWAVVNDWAMVGGVEAPRNVVLVSVPSLLDPDMCPPGKHIIHAYVPATEPYEDWVGLDRRSPEYKQKKDDAADFLWSAVERYIPDARSRSDKRVEQIGTPLTHERFLRRSFGSYGPRIPAGSDMSLPSHKTALEGFYMVGDYTFPGIGVPAAATSGAVAANTILSLPTQLRLLQRMRLPERS